MFICSMPNVYTYDLGFTLLYYSEKRLRFFFIYRCDITFKEIRSKTSE